MVRAEINEIKKLYKLNDCSVTRICGCYVDGEKNIKDQWAKSFLAMDEEDLLKYLALFKKCFSGGLGKNLINVEVPEKNVQESFLALRDTALREEEVLEAFYERIIDTYEYVGNYLILVIHDVYDVPGKTQDGIEMEDASDTVYDYILACICPVSLSRPGLGYDSEKNTFTHMNQEWMLGDPQLAILYPAFNDRAADENAALLYARNLKEDEKTFVSRLLGCRLGMPPAQEKEVFEAILQETLGMAELKEVRAVQQKLIELAEEHYYDPEPFKLDKAAVKNVLLEAGISEDKMNYFEESYHGNVPADAEILLSNIVNLKSFNVDTGIGHIRTTPEYAKEISIQEIDGRMCLVMNIIGDVSVNGIDVSVAEE